MSLTTEKTPLSDITKAIIKKLIEMGYNTDSLLMFAKGNLKIDMKAFIAEPLYACYVSINVSSKEANSEIENMYGNEALTEYLNELSEPIVSLDYPNYKTLLTDEQLIKAGFERNIMLKIAASVMRNNLDANVLDPHYGTIINTDLALAFHNGYYILVGFDSSNQIVEVKESTAKAGLEFDNTNILGSRKEGNKIEGWAFDRKDSFIYGYETTGYYKAS